MKKIGFSIFMGLMILLIAIKSSADTGFTEVNNALFDSPHMKNIMKPGTLHYSYKKESYIEDSAEDTIDVEVTNIRNTGRRDLSFEFFTGPNRRPYKDMENQQGNGMFVLFLEWDVHELERQTEGSWRHFQRRIRWAFAEGATKKEVEIDFQGKKLKGIQYSIQPYASDPKSTRYRLYANKYYVFTLSEDIQGEIYQIKTIVPDGKVWRDGDVPLTTETITFTGFDEK
ncbi:MAG: hypothetical protein DRI46_12600 [Chloroflexi bacterium]|nr:MAG: hypothetical protein DRI46_12600 [Chloroflexota bacterium]